MRVFREEAPRLPARINYTPTLSTRNPTAASSAARGAILEFAPPASAASPPRQRTMSPHGSPLARLTTPPIDPRTPPRTPLDLVGLDGDIYLTRSPPKRLPALAESTSAPMLRPSDPLRRVAEASHPAASEHPYMQSVADSTRTLTKRNKLLEARLEEMSELLIKERKGRRAREERRAAQQEVARKQIQESHEEEVRRLRAALAKLEAKYQRGVQRYEERLRGASDELKAALEKQVTERCRHWAKQAAPPPCPATLCLSLCVRLLPQHPLPLPAMEAAGVRSLLLS